MNVATETVSLPQRFAPPRHWWPSAATRASSIAVLAVGYADGYSRSLGNRARVLIRGRRYPVVGNMCSIIHVTGSTR